MRACGVRRFEQDAVLAEARPPLTPVMHVALEYRCPETSKVRGEW